MDTAELPEKGVQRRHVWLLGLGVMGALAIVLLPLLSTAPPHPNRVLLLGQVDGERSADAGLSGRLVMELGHRLQGLGFEVATAANPIVADALGTAPRDVAHAQEAIKARWRVDVTLQFDEKNTAVPGDHRELHGTGRVVWTGLSAESGGEQRFDVWGGSRQPRLTRAQLISGPVVHRAATVISRGLVAAEAAEVLAGVDLTPSLGPARAAVAADRARGDARDAAAVLATTERAAGEKGPHPVTYHDAFDAKRVICAVGPKGALVWRIPVRGAATDGLMEGEEHQQLSWRTAGGQAERVWMGPRIHGPATATRDGKMVALSEVIYSWARTLTVVDGTGTRRLVTAANTVFTDLNLSPGGQYLGALARECAKCAQRIVVYRTTDGSKVLDLDDEGGAFSGVAWADDDRLLLLHTPAPPSSVTPPAKRRFAGADQSLWALTVTTPGIPPKRVFTDARGLRYAGVHAEHGRAVLVPGSGGGRGLRVVTLVDGRDHLVSTPHRATAPRFSADGRHLVFNLHFGSDTEVAMAPVEGGECTILTRNALNDFRPAFTPDGQRILFEAVSRHDRTNVSAALASIPRPRL